MEPIASPPQKPYRPLYRLRTDRSIDRTSLARFLGVSYSAIQKAETTDPYAIGLQKYLALSREWNVPLHEFDPPKYRHYFPQETS